MIAQSRIDDATAEALLTGRAVSAEFEPLAELVRAFRRTAERPVPPTPELAHQMATGLFTDPAECTVPASRNGHRRRWWRERSGTRTRTAAFVTAAGAAALVTALGTAGFAGVLPAPAQERFEDVVESVTPIEFPGRVDGGTEDAGTSDGTDSDGTDSDGTDSDEFGEQVSDDARDGGVDGGETSELGREQGDQRRPTARPTPAPPATAGPVTPGAPPDLPAPAEPEPPAADPPAPPGADLRPSAPPGR